MINLRLDGPPSRTYTPDANNIEGEVGFKRLWQKITVGTKPGGRPTRQPGGKPAPGWGPKVPQGGKPVPDQGGRRPEFSQGNGGGGWVPPLPTRQAVQAEIDAFHAEIRGCMADMMSSPRCAALMKQNAYCATDPSMHDCVEEQLPIVGGGLPGTTATVDPTGDPRTWFQKYGKLSMGAIGAGILAVGAAIFLRDN
jgi:hypothetical protein